MNVLLVIAHGSRRDESNLEIESLTNKIASFNTKVFDVVMPAFLEFAEPSIVEVIQKCSDIGAKKVTVLPYFLSAGVHITRDIPGEIQKASDQYPKLEIEITNYFGARDEIAEILIKAALEVN